MPSNVGHVGELIYRMDADSNEYYMAVIFDSKESYVANANSPDQNDRYEEMLALLESAPEWHDGEIVHSYREEGVGHNLRSLPSCYGCTWTEGGQVGRKYAGLAGAAALVAINNAAAGHSLYPPPERATFRNILE